MTFPSIRIEGTILSGELLAKLDSTDTRGQRHADFGFDMQSKLKDEIVRAWTAGQAFYKAFQHKLEGAKEGTAATSETRNQWIIPLLGLLGYAELEFQAQSELVGDKPFRVSHRLRSHGGFAVHIVGARESLDKKPVAGSGVRVSPHAHLQEYLNLTEHLYGIVTNGKLLRLLRDSTRLIKLSYVEFDLDRMFTEELFADFAILFRLLHITRLPHLPEKSAESLLEHYHQDALESGARIRDGLSIAVEQVIQELGCGFLAANENLRTISARDLHHSLLRLIYRLLLMMVAEERGLLFPETIKPAQRKIYLDHYSIARLRRLAERRSLVDPTKHDLWLGLRSTFRLFETDGPGTPLGLTGLGGQLFSASALGALQSAELDNGTLLSALAKLSLFRQPNTGQLSRVNYGALATEEFGSVYERLLELHPVINPAVGNPPPTFGFKQAAGNERKTTGSYYTPSSLVECLLDSALDPVLEGRLKNFAKLGYKSADEAVLALKVCDPACGSGHFLIAAAQRIARRLALLRSKGDEPSVSELRHTLREVISHCVYGVDLNPMSVELCKVALWLEAMEAGKPLSFLDHHIRWGNSLLGTTPVLIAEGIPDDAFTAIEGDDKKASAALKKLNARERSGFGELFALEDRATFERLERAAVAVENLPDDSVRAIEQKSAAFERLQHNYDFEKATDLANLWCAAFVIHKRMADAELSGAATAQSVVTERQPSATQTGLFGETFQQSSGKAKRPSKAVARPSGLAEAIGITSGHLRDFAKGAALPDALVKEARQLSVQYRFFHWHLAFPEVFSRGGFDVMLGNPPWDKVQPEEQKFFAVLRPDIAQAENARIRKELIASLPTSDTTAHALWTEYKRHVAGVSQLLKFSGVIRFSCEGNLNTYRAFTELSSMFVAPLGRVGMVIQTGLATDESGKELFDHLLTSERLLQFLDFENKEGFFQDVDSRFRFCLITIGGKDGKSRDGSGRFGWLLHSLEETSIPGRLVQLSAADLRLFTPTSRTCPVFVSESDLRIGRGIYQNGRHIYLTENDRFGNIDFLGELFNLTRDSSYFLNSDEAVETGAEVLPLYEAKYLHQFDHRFATVANGKVDDTTARQKATAEFTVKTSKVVIAREVRTRLAKRAIAKKWLLGFRDISSGTNERTAIMAVFPVSAVGNSINMVLGLNSIEAAALVANSNSFAFDYCCRQKVGGTHVNIWIYKQLPVVPLDRIEQPCAWSGGAQTLKDWLLPRVMELTYTAWDLEAFAQDCGWSCPPFRWNDERRFQLRCELDAAFFHLYGLNRDDTGYILDTFPIVKRKDEEKFGTYRTKDCILELYDALAEAISTGKAYQTRLDPPPADSRCCHPLRAKA